MFVVLAQTAMTVATIAGTIAAALWIRKRPAGDPAVDRLLLVTSPLFWLLKRYTRRR